VKHRIRVPQKVNSQAEKTRWAFYCLATDWVHLRLSNPKPGQGQTARRSTSRIYGPPRRMGIRQSRRNRRHPHRLARPSRRKPQRNQTVQGIIFGSSSDRPESNSIDIHHRTPLGTTPRRHRLEIPRTALRIPRRTRRPRSLHRNPRTTQRQSATSSEKPTPKSPSHTPAPTQKCELKPSNATSASVPTDSSPVAPAATALAKRHSGSCSASSSDHADRRSMIAKSSVACNAYASSTTMPATPEPINWSGGLFMRRDTRL